MEKIDHNNICKNIKPMRNMRYETLVHENAKHSARVAPRSTAYLVIKKISLEIRKIKMIATNLIINISTEQCRKFFCV